ncbi:hypothetical protein D1871_05955 [Nakamurella silvestris]|nr:hypothetical protein D1871_05955 [Nakamurella silvestris]
MSALTHWKKILLGSVASIAMLGAAVAPAASAATLPVTSAPVPVLQGGAGAEHPISVRVLSIYMHDDSDGVGAGCGEFVHFLDKISVFYGPGLKDLGDVVFDNGTARTGYYDAPTKLEDYTQHYCSDHNYPMPQDFNSDNKLFAKGTPGQTLDMRATMDEADPVGFVAMSFGGKVITVPEVGKDKVVSFDVESVPGFTEHIRATLTVRVATAA